MDSPEIWIELCHACGVQIKQAFAIYRRTTTRYCFNKAFQARLALDDYSITPQVGAPQLVKSRPDSETNFHLKTNGYNL